MTEERCGLIAKIAEADEAGGEGLLLAPLLIREQVCGVIYLEGEDFKETHLQLMVAIVQVASMALENAFHLEWLEAENARLEGELHPGHHMIGDSARLRELQRNIQRAAQTNSTVLIIGETGTGKELVARAMHQNSPRAGQPFIAVNCAALTETLLESELFGHEKGAFTGAFAQKKGRLEVAASGTVFLDEIGEMPLQLQVKLLRVLQERQMERVGGTQPIKLDFRLIAATNRNLEEEVRAGRFRQDLYYRLNVVTLKTPPLRERQSDIPVLAMHFASKFGAQCGRRISGISPEAQASLLRYDWPGNIRELENALERAVVLGSTDMIQLEDLPESIWAIARPADLVRAPGLQDAIDHAKREAIAQAFQQAKNDHAGAARAAPASSELFIPADAESGDAVGQASRPVQGERCSPKSGPTRPAQAECLPHNGGQNVESRGTGPSRLRGGCAASEARRAQSAASPAPSTYCVAIPERLCS